MVRVCVCGTRPSTCGRRAAVRVRGRGGVAHAKLFPAVGGGIGGVGWVVWAVAFGGVGRLLAGCQVRQEVSPLGVFGEPR